VQQVRQLSDVGDCGVGRSHRMHDTALIRSDVQLHSEVPILALAGLLHLRVASRTRVLGRTRRRDDGCVHDGTQAQWQPLAADQPNNLVYLRRRLFRRRQFSDPTIPPYHLDKSERGLDPGGLFAKVVSQIVPGIGSARNQTDLQEMLKAAEINGVPLYRYGLWDLLLRGMSIEAWSMTRAAIGYDTVSWNTNAAELIFGVFEVAGNVTYRRVKQGYETVPRQLASHFVSAGGRIEMKRRLKGFELVRHPLGEKMLALSFAGVSEPVYARVLVLAMPKRSLRVGQ
jgi:hypothetical protein